MPSTSNIAARFQRDTAQHEMTVLHDDGLYRHLRFAQPKPASSAYWFDLITWPGCLTIRGDLNDSYTFSRLPDMFEFFRGPVGRINAHYWAEKLGGGRQSVQEYSEDLFRQLVVEHFVDAVRYSDAPRGLGKAVREEILNSEFLAVEEEARQVLNSFEYGAKFKASCMCDAAAEFSEEIDAVRWRSEHIQPGYVAHLSSVTRVEGFRFEDTWEWSFSDYDWSFLWACHAIVWGIGQYDAPRKSVAA
jgi:hypothetical protein